MTGSDIERAMEAAVRLHESGDVAAAGKIYRDVLEHSPHDADALHLLGVISLNGRRLTESLDLMQRAIAAQPDVAEFHLDLGRAHIALGNREAAIDALSAATRLDDTLADAWFLLGKMLLPAERRRDASAALQKAADLLPDLPAAHQELCEALILISEFDRAADAARTVVRLRPQDPVGEFLLGNAFRAATKMIEAADAYRRSLAIDPRYVPSMLHLASVYWYTARQEEAVALCRAAIEIAPQYAIAHHTLGTALERMGRFDEAAEAYREALRIDPMDANWRFDLASMTGDDTPAAPPKDFVIRLFDEYAPRFEEHLVSALQYRGPEQLLALVKSHLPVAQHAARALDVMDLGCGTGLCGRAFRPLARSLVGVDLSPRMAEIAQKTGIYDRVTIADVTDALRACPADSLDLIVAGDVFIYVGALEGILAASAPALHRGGWLAFTVEAHDQPGYALGRTHRYVHSLDYVHATAAASGLTNMQSQQVVLRLNERQAVQGWAILLQKS